MSDELARNKWRLDFEYDIVSFIGGSKIVWILSKFAERRREETETRKSVSFDV